MKTALSLTTVSLVVFAAATLARLHAEEKPQPAASPEAPRPQIAIECKVLQITGESYQQNHEFFESAIKASPTEAAEDFLKKLNDIKGLDLLPVPGVSIRSGQKGIIKIVRQFPFPKTFDKDGKPTAWDNRDLGMTFEIEPSEINGKIRLSGTFIFTEFLGYIENGENGLRTPAFQTREAHILREQPSGASSLFLVPWQGSTSTLLSATRPNQDATPPAPTAQRVMLWIKTTSVAAYDTALNPDKTLLQEVILHDLDYHDVRIDKVMDDVLVRLSQKKVVPPFFDKLQGELAPKFTFKGQAISVADLFAKIREQTGYILCFTPSGLDISVPADTAHSNVAGHISGYSNELHQEPSLSIGDVQLRDDAPGTKVLRIATKAKPGSRVDARNLKLRVFFYEKDDAGELHLTDSKVTAQWITSPVDWKDQEPELTDVTYTLPEGTGSDGAPHRQFAGYVVGIYYNGELQDSRAEPVALAEKFPLPLSLKQDSH